MRHRPRAVLGSTVAVLALLTASCGDDGEPVSSPTTADDTVDTTTSTTPASVDGESLPDTLAELVGPATSLDPGAAQQWYLERERERQEALAQCMAEQGFEYEPVDPAELSESPWDAEIPWESEEWVETYGFGISTLRYPQSVVGPDLVGYVDEPADDSPHPNQVHVQNLPPEEREAWQDARNDCDRATWEDSQSQNLAAAFNQRFSEELTEMYDELAADPRYEQIRDEIRQCVNDMGIDYVDRQTTFQELESRLAPLDDQIDESGASPDALAQLAGIQEDEIAVATAVADCGGRFLSDNEAYRDLVAEYEADFIDEHEEELRDFLGSA